MKRKTHDEFVNDVKSKYGNEYTVIGRYVNNKEYIKLRHNCDKCNNHIFDMRPNDFLYGHKCPFCFPKSVLKTDDMFRKQVIDLYNDEYTVMGKYLCNSEKILMRHNNESCNNYEWLVLPRDFLGGKSKCPECSKLIRSAKTKKSIESVQAKFNEYYGDNEYTVLEYINYNTPIKVLHNECNTQFTIHSNNAYKKNGCPCKHCKSGSIGINYIKKFLDDNSIVFNEEVTYQNMVYKDKLKIDICFDSINLEYDGDQHFKRGRGRNEDERKEKVQLQQRRDTIKNDYCLNNRLCMIRIPYTQEKNLNVIMSAIVSNDLSILSEYECLIIKDGKIINRPEIYAWYKPNLK